MLEIIDIHKSYEDQPLLSGISFSVSLGEVLCLLGPSGSGKSTLLRLIAGLEIPERGRILWEGRNITLLPAYMRDFGLVFQEYALFPHLDVAGNVGFGLRMKAMSSSEIRMRVADALRRVNLSGFGDRRVTDLSGGEQQRVALARALAPNPRLLMFDEPLGALDRSLKESMLEEIHNILRETRVPAIYVTHDQEEAFTIGTRVMLLHEGRIAQSGTPAEVLASPATAWVAQFLAAGNIVPAEIQDRQAHTAVGIFDLPCQHKHRSGEKINLLLDKQAVELIPGGEIKGRVADVLFFQGVYKVKLDNGLVFLLRGEPKVGEEIRIHVLPAGIKCLP